MPKLRNTSTLGQVYRREKCCVLCIKSQTPPPSSLWPHKTTPKLTQRFVFSLLNVCVFKGPQKRICNLLWVYCVCVCVIERKKKLQQKQESGIILQIFNSTNNTVNVCVVSLLCIELQIRIKGSNERKEGLPLFLGYLYIEQSRHIVVLDRLVFSEETRTGLAVGSSHWWRWQSTHINNKLILCRFLFFSLWEPQSWPQWAHQTMALVLFCVSYLVFRGWPKRVFLR